MKAKRLDLKLLGFKLQRELLSLYDNRDERMHHCSSEEGNPCKSVQRGYTKMLVLN